MRKSFLQLVPSSFLIGTILALAPPLNAQGTESQTSFTFSGTVCDAEKRPMRGVEVILENAANSSSVIRTKSDAQGRFEFDQIPAGRYKLRSDRAVQGAASGTLLVDIGTGKSNKLQSCWVQTGPAKDAATAIPFSDEPQFTVAGVTDTTALGVHASSRSNPNSTALAKDTVALGRGGSDAASEGAATRDEAEIQAKLAKEENADLRFDLAEIEEKAGHPVEAARDYQLAAEHAPTEAHLFGWGAELLLHRAFEPAIEVFGKGHERYPDSVRMLLGLGTAYYGQGANEDAAQYFLQASDLEPKNPRPYLFLGELLGSDTVVPQTWVERLQRFAIVNPENAMAHYLYAVALAKQNPVEHGATAEAELNKAIELDSRLGDAYLQRGILKSGAKDFPGAVADLQKAIEYTPYPGQAHYRLAQVYRRMGESEKAREETERYKEVAAKRAENAERERHEIQQFVYTLRDATPNTEPAAGPKKPQ